jgi:hypothetical protein
VRVIISFFGDLFTLKRVVSLTKEYRIETIVSHPNLLILNIEHDRKILMPIFLWKTFQY